MSIAATLLQTRDFDGCLGTRYVFALWCSIWDIATSTRSDPSKPGTFKLQNVDRAIIAWLSLKAINTESHRHNIFSLDLGSLVS